MRTGESILSSEDAAHFVSLLDCEEETLLLTALLLSLSFERSKKAADEAGYDLEPQ